MAKKYNIDLLIENFQNGEFPDFYDAYNKFQEKAIKNKEGYEELLRQFPRNLSEEIMKPWQKSFVNCIEFVEICTGLQNVRGMEERLKRKKSDMINHIVNMLKENMLLYGDKSIRKKEKFFTILVYTDILTAFPIEEEKYIYLGILWDVLRQIESNMEAHMFYGKECQEGFLKRSKYNLKLCGIKAKEIQEQLEVESKEYICRYLTALTEVIEQENTVERKTPGKRTKAIIRRIVVPVGCVFVVIFGFLVMGNSAKENKELKVQYEKVLEENQKLEQTKKDLAQTKKDLEEKIKNLEKEFVEQQAKGAEKFVLEEKCELLKEENEDSFMIQMLPEKAEVIVLEKMNNGWLKVIYQGEIGYINYSSSGNE